MLLTDGLADGKAPSRGATPAPKSKVQRSGDPKRKPNAPMNILDAANSPGAVHWAVSRRPVAYPVAVEAMEARAGSIAAGEAPELIWLLEHPPVYTAGTSAKAADLVDPERFPVFKTGRGGQHTYHGPGQRVVYVLLDVRHRFDGNVRGFVRFLEDVVIETLAHFGIEGHMRPERVGVWVERPDKGDGAEDKVAALGIRIRRGISFHGFAINVDPDLSHFSGIVPCGISEHGVTSLRALGSDASLDEVDRVLRSVFSERLGALCDIEATDPALMAR
jgi:lipoyl(octanoyl) transferase